PGRRRRQPRLRRHLIAGTSGDRSVKTGMADSLEPMTEPTPTSDSRTPHGPFRAGDQVQLTDPKGRINTITLQTGKQFHSHKGWVDHDEIIGGPEGIVVRSTGGIAFLVFRPLLQDYAGRMPRGAAVVWPKDAGMIVALAAMLP